MRNIATKIEMFCNFIWSVLKELCIIILPVEFLLNDFYISSPEMHFAKIDFFSLKRYEILLYYVWNTIDCFSF